MVSETHQQLLSGALGLSLLVSGLTGCQIRQADPKKTAAQQADDIREQLHKKIEALKNGSSDRSFFVRQQDGVRMRIEYAQEQQEYTLPCYVEYSWITQDKVNGKRCYQTLGHIFSMPTSNIHLYCSLEATKAALETVEVETKKGVKGIYADESARSSALINTLFIAPELVEKLNITRENDTLVIKGTTGGSFFLHGLCSSKSATQIIASAAFDISTNKLHTEAALCEKGSVTELDHNYIVHFTDQSQLSARLLKQKLSETAKLFPPEYSMTPQQHASNIKARVYEGDFREETKIDAAIDTAILNFVFYNEIIKYKNSHDRELLFEAVTEAMKNKKSQSRGVR